MYVVALCRNDSLDIFRSDYPQYIKCRVLLMMAMHPHHPVPLYPNPPYTRDELLSDASSDFPPIRVRESSSGSPGPPVRTINQSCYFLTVQEQLEQPLLSKSAPQLSRHPWRLTKGLAHKNIHNMIEAPVQDAKVRNQTLQILILITSLSECSQILVKARPRTSRYRQSPPFKKTLSHFP